MKKYYVHYKTVDDGPTGYPNEYEGYIGPFDTKEQANKEMEEMDEEQWISGQNTYFNTYVIEKDE